jgi:hypothetical protein
MKKVTYSFSKDEYAKSLDELLAVLLRIIARQKDA